MKLDYLKDSKDFVTIALLGISAFLGIVILIKVTVFFVDSARAESLVEKAAAQSRPDPNDMEKYFVESRTIADELKNKNLFAPPPAKQALKQVSGILGDEVLINGKWYKVGDRVGDSKIVAIEAAQVRIEWEGKEIILSPMQATSSPGPGARGRTRADIKKGKEPNTQTVQTRPQRRPMPERQGRRRSRNLSPEARARRRERLENTSEEKKQETKNNTREK